MSEPDIVQKVKDKLPPNWFYYAGLILGFLAIIAGLVLYLRSRRKRAKQ